MEEEQLRLLEEAKKAEEERLLQAIEVRRKHVILKNSCKLYRFFFKISKFGN